MAETKKKTAKRTVKKATPTSLKWNDLTQEQRNTITSKIVKAVKAMAGPKYRIVQGDDVFQRERGIPETRKEDEILNPSRRGAMLDLARNAVRNSATFSAILKQLQVNIVGVNGGKAIFNYDSSNEAVKRIRKEFSKWTREAEFYDGLNFNTVLKMILNTYVVNGDMVLLMDDGLVEDSGKLIVFESDAIVDVNPVEVEKRFGKGFTISQGRVYNPHGRFCGVVVSRSQKGQLGDANPDACYFLKRDLTQSQFDNYWMMPRNIWRFEQGRGVSQAASCLGAILDSEDLTGFELQSAKKNAQTFAQIYNTQPQAEENVPMPFDADADFSEMTDQQIEEVAKEVAKDEEKTVSLQAARSAGIIFEQMPDNYKMELLSPNHPNESVMDFVKWLAGRSASVFGLTQQYATLAATGSDYKAERLLTEPVFKEGRKFLEQICDWVFWRWLKWAKKKGLVKEYIAEDFMQNVSWAWPDTLELDENANQQAWALKLKNMTGSYRDYYGNEWREKLKQIAEEREWMLANGIVPPQDLMISGGQTKQSQESSTTKTEIEEEEDNPEQTEEPTIEEVEEE